MKKNTEEVIEKEPKPPAKYKDEKFKFPTLRQLVLTDEKVAEIEAKLYPYSKHDFGKIIYFAKGKHITHEGPNGGIFSTGKEMTHNAISFEVQTTVFDVWRQRKRTLYLLVWMGGYTKGSVFHCGWQYPHQISFSDEDLNNTAKNIYKDLVKIFYNNEVIDKDILKFIEN